MPRSLVDAAVLVPIVLRGSHFSQTMVVLTQRAQHMSTHAGQIAFPGGKVDPLDHNRHATALREAHEEIGLHPQHVHIIGTLPVYVTASAFSVTPVVALISSECTLRPNADEVQDVFEVPLAFLMNPANHRHHRLEWRGAQRQWFSMPYREPKRNAQGHTVQVERFIWGATAAMLRNLYRFLVADPTP